MIHAYIDDSGDPQKQIYAVCGGVLGEAFAMTATENLWAAETEELTEPFRSTDCECHHGQFKEWEKWKCNDLMARLVGVLAHPSVRCGAFGVAISIPHFKAAFPGCDQDDPFRVAIRHALIELCKFCRRYNERVHVWFESGPNDADILRAYNEVKGFKFPNSSERDRLAQISFGDKALIPLQAADLAARECFKAAMNVGKRPIRKPLQRLWGQVAFQVLPECCMLKLKESDDPFSAKAINALGIECHQRYVDATPHSQTIIPI
jgi:hypothetical protein